MKVSMNWINAYTDLTGITAKQYADAMTMSGSKVEGVENPAEEISNVVVGKILSQQKHPDADKLQVCQVDVGEQTVQIVTGAQNIKTGDLVPVALHKSTLPGGVKITKGKLRGVESCGMMCSHEELGMDLSDYAGACADGILIIQEELPPGMDICEALGLDENIIEFEITSNRADCFSVLGLARETAVTFGRPLNLHTPAATGKEGDAHDYASVEVLDTSLCSRYAARIVKNVKIGPSPKWLRDRLKGCGVRSINNVVDITNYVMLEYGQPMHAFDLNFLDGGKIVVRRAAEDEKITTLDGVERTLNPSMLVIADGAKPVAVAGVMGGENSEITSDTKTILFECANFDGASVRVTAKKLGLRTEASGRYEKGLDAAMIPEAVNRACELMEQLGAGEVVAGIIDVNHAPEDNRKIPFYPEKINRFLGCDISRGFMEDTLSALSFRIVGDICTPPSFRKDIEGMADVAEEVARFYGYDKIPSTLLRGDATPGGRNARQVTEDKIKAILVGIGCFEIMTYSFTSPKTFDLLQMDPHDPKRNVVKIKNPLGEENSVMRTTTIGSMLEILARNYNYRNTCAKLFELGTVYLPQEGKQLPEEPQKVTIGMYGSVDFYDLKGAVEDLLTSLNVKKYSFAVENSNPSFHPGRTAKLMIRSKQAGLLGEIHPAVAENYSIPVKTYVAELDFNAIFESIDNAKAYRPLPKFPAVTRDIAVLVEKQVLVAEIESVIRKVTGNLLEELKLFDVYQGDRIAEDKKSVAYSLALRSADHTLAEEEITAVMDKVVAALKDSLDAQLR